MVIGSWTYLFGMRAGLTGTTEAMCLAIDTLHAIIGEVKGCDPAVTFGDTLMS